MVARLMPIMTHLLISSGTRTTIIKLTNWRLIIMLTAVGWSFNFPALFGLPKCFFAMPVINGSYTFYYGGYT